MHKIFPAFQNGNNGLSMKEIPEKTLFRCTILGIVQRYFKNYATDCYEIEWDSGENAIERVSQFLKLKLGVDEKDILIYKTDADFLKIENILKNRAKE
jgi:hypothetical protein